MIIVINGSEKEQYRAVLDQYFRIRAQVFDERLKWDVIVQDGMEFDAFDDLNPVYLISVDEQTGQVRGGLRMLPTTGPNMLRDIFPFLLPDGDVIQSPTIWEVSRFAMDHFSEAPDPGRLLSYVTGELLAGVVEVSMQSGISFVVAVFDPRMRRVCHAAGCPPEILGEPQKVGDYMTYAGLFEMSDNELANIRNACGIEGSVLIPQNPRKSAAA